MDTLTQEHDLLHRALASLSVHDIDARVLPSGPHTTHDGDGDAQIEVTWAGRTTPFVVEVKRLVRPSTVAAVVDRMRASRSTLPVILVSEFISRETAELLSRRGIQFIDAAGNVHIATSDLLIFVTGRSPAPGTASARHDRIGRAALQTMFTILRAPAAAGLSVRELGERAGVSHGAAATALRAFDRRGWIRHAGRDGYSLVAPEAMLSAWLHGFTDQVLASLELSRATHPGADTLRTWSASVLDQFSPTVGLLGGEGAAEVAGNNIRGASASVYVCRWDAATMRSLRLAPSPTGAISVRPMFAPNLHDPDDPRLVDPLLVLGELSAIPDERLDATRASLRAAITARFTR